MPRIEVVSHENGWKVIEDGADTGEIYETQERAVEAARSRAGEDADVDVKSRMTQQESEPTALYRRDGTRFAGQRGSLTRTFVSGG